MVEHVLRKHESELYNLENDPTEQVNLLQQHPHIVRQLQDDLKARKCVPVRQLEGPDRMAPTDIARLRSLGYVGA